jgi:hypothetical protein
MFDSIKYFTADKFSPTKFEKAEAKVRFAKQFIRFVESDFDLRLFPHWFYTRLALTFSHIAHYDQAGFFETFFTNTEDKVKFLKQTLQHPCYGDPIFTYSDVEKALQSWLFQQGVLAKFEQRLADEHEASERAELQRLRKKFEAGT